MQGTRSKALAFSIGIHLMLGGLLFVTWSQPVEEAEAVAVELVDIPWDGDAGDAGNQQRSAAKVPAPATPRQTAQARTSERVVAPRKAPVAAAPVKQSNAKPQADWDSILAKRMAKDRAEEARRLAQLASAADDDAFGGSGDDPGTASGGSIDTGSGVSGDLARRQILNRVVPEYPAAARRQGIEGEVRLRIWVSPQGRVSRVEVVKVSGTPEMDERAIQALKRWTFAPLSSEQAPMTQWGELTLRYRLD